MFSNLIFADFDGTDTVFDGTDFLEEVETDLGVILGFTTLVCDMPSIWTVETKNSKRSTSLVIFIGKRLFYIMKFINVLSSFYTEGISKKIFFNKK
jgi:hypothetical protein